MTRIVLLIRSLVVGPLAPLVSFYLWVRQMIEENDSSAQKK